MKRIVKFSRLMASRRPIKAAPFVSRRGPWSADMRPFSSPHDPHLDKSRYGCPRIVTDRSIRGGRRAEQWGIALFLGNKQRFLCVRINLFSPDVNLAFTLVHLSIVWQERLSSCIYMSKSWLMVKFTQASPDRGIIRTMIFLERERNFYLPSL